MNAEERAKPSAAMRAAEEYANDRWPIVDEPEYKARWLDACDAFLAGWRARGERDLEIVTARDEMGLIYGARRFVAREIAALDEEDPRHES